MTARTDRSDAGDARRRGRPGHGAPVARASGALDYVFGMLPAPDALRSETETRSRFTMDAHRDADRCRAAIADLTRRMRDG